ncbi:MAG: hypothetical protein FJY81_00405 [Candidatus Aminicenantes bacterium]|nr:hypothetical protein [Candidatus Aminicenantes bacterium]
MNFLRFSVFISLGFSLLLLALQVRHARSFGKRRLFSSPAGNSRKGAIYAFGRGMLPWEKESAARHLPTYIAGMAYHAGIFAAIFFVLALAARVRLPEATVHLLRILMAAGFLAGTGLLLKRAVHPRMRHISCPDDFGANLLVDVFLLTGILASWRAAVLPVFFIVAAATFLYMPLSKIRHCFFFFYSRLVFGSYFGRRGVLPPAGGSKSRAGS